MEPGEDWTDVQIPAPSQDTESVVAETKAEPITSPAGVTNCLKRIIFFYVKVFLIFSSNEMNQFQGFFKIVYFFFQVMPNKKRFLILM